MVTGAEAGAPVQVNVSPHPQIVKRVREEYVLILHNIGQYIAPIIMICHYLNFEYSSRQSGVVFIVVPPKQFSHSKVLNEVGHSLGRQLQTQEVSLQHLRMNPGSQTYLHIQSKQFPGKMYIVQRPPTSSFNFN